MKNRSKKKKKPPSKQQLKRGKRSISSDIVGIILIFLGLLLLVSLISYDPHDPSWASVSTSGQSIHNYAGRIGASIAEAFFQFMGFVSFIIPFAFFYMGIRSFLPNSPGKLVQTLALCLLILILSPLNYLIFNSVVWRGEEVAAGGLIGTLISSVLTSNLNHTGSLIVLLGFLILFLIFSTRFSLGKIFHFFPLFFGFAFKTVKLRITRYRKEKRREKKRQHVIKKYSAPKKEEKDTTVKKEKKEKKIKKKAPKKEPKPKKSPEPRSEEKLLFPEIEKKGDYSFPPFNLLDPGKAAERIDKNELFEKKQLIEEKLREFKVDGEIKEYHPGPVVTTYEFFPYPGIKVSQVANLSEEVALALSAKSVRIQRIPGKSSLGVEAPNNKREIIKVRDIIQSEKFLKSPSKLTFALGKSKYGDIYVTDLAVMPHLLIAGATGTGKSVTMNSLIASILYKATPEEVKLILIDPKRLEFSIYDGIPHLMSPVVRDPKKAEAVLLTAIKEMDGRYHKLGLLGVRNIEQYNNQVEKILNSQKGKITPEQENELKPLPYIVIIIDELAELMMIGKQEVEYCIARLAQLARAVGIHLVLATQRPSIDVITGTIKNNFSCRIAFRVPTKVDSRIIIDTRGAEQLLGDGDMLFMPPNYPRLLRLHGSYISLPEVNRLIKFVKEQGKPTYDNKMVKVLKGQSEQIEEGMDERDPLFEKAVELVLVTGQASASFLQRRLKLGYARAARIIDQMEHENIVGPSEGSKPREILVDPQTYLKRMEGEE
jgi:S-DNA-T family DNA segregation ATPase FtsK/SpoIIIE